MSEPHTAEGQLYIEDKKAWSVFVLFRHHPDKHLKAAAWATLDEEQQELVRRSLGKPKKQGKK